MFLAINQSEIASKKRKQHNEKMKEKEKTEYSENIITKSPGITETDMIAAATSFSAKRKPVAPAVSTTTLTPAMLEKAKLIDNMLLDFSAVGMETEKCKNCQHAIQYVQRYRKNQQQQHPLLRQNDQNQQLQREKLLSPTDRVPCQCDCDCVNKTFALFNSLHDDVQQLHQSPHQRQDHPSLSSMAAVLPPKRISLYTVYICLGIVALALATLSVLFYSHVNNCAVELETLNALPVTATRTTMRTAAKMTTDRKGLLPVETNADVKYDFREQFQRELVASDHVLRSIVARILQEDFYNVPNVGSQFGTGDLTHLSTSKANKLQGALEESEESVVLNERKMQKADQSRKRRDISSAPTSMHSDPLIEFFNPNHRKALEEQDVEIRKRTGLKGAAPGGDEWIYLNTYCRVPEKIITGFCRSTQDYCPPSPQGPPGPIGPKGLVGRPGLDGRDGVPGEPGLDGVPGRAGADGKDGMPGQDGRDGKDGKDGKDGSPGPKGAIGPPGEKGAKGNTGARGRAGKNGESGAPGKPGVIAWKLQFQNGSYSDKLFVPPSIADNSVPHIRRSVIVEEGKTLNLSCAAGGIPMPRIEWRRDDGRTINVNGVEASSVKGEFLIFNNITRYQMAAYNCFADNGIPPVANATYLVEVHFSPMITVFRQMIYAEYGKTATLECWVEAFPEAIRYWERAYDGKILNPGEKYQMESHPEGFKTTMRLTIINLHNDDFGFYHCVARNEINATMASYEIAPQDPNSEKPFVENEQRHYGSKPPQSQCPKCEQCPDTSLYQCKDSINSNFEVQETGNIAYKGVPRKRKNCLLYAVGKPVFHKEYNNSFGAWLKDSEARDVDREKTFVTSEGNLYQLQEFSTKNQFRNSITPPRVYELKEGFQGNAHVVYKGSFFYNQLNTDIVVKLNLETLEKMSRPLPYSGYSAERKLYTTNYNYMDFNVDDVGLWVIYSTKDSNNTLVSLLDTDTLDIKMGYNLTFDHTKFGEMFIVCGHLYAIDSVTEKNSQIRYVVDLYRGKLLNIHLPFSNPFRKTTTVGYNPYTVELYSWDRGNALTYPIRYHEQSVGIDNS